MATVGCSYQRTRGRTRAWVGSQEENGTHKERVIRPGWLSGDSNGFVSRLRRTQGFESLTRLQYEEARHREHRHHVQQGEGIDAEEDEVLLRVRPGDSGAMEEVSGVW